MTSAAGASVHVRRARKLLLGGLAGGVTATVVCLIVFAVLHGSDGLASAGLGAATVLFFYAVGQLVMVRFADAGARTLLAVSMASYTARVVLLGLLLLFYNGHRDSWPDLVPMGVFVTTIAVVAGWLLAEVYVFSRLRIGHYDTEYVPASDKEFEQ
jgi:CHASE2 domain-containing sensor protein